MSRTKDIRTAQEATIRNGMRAEVERGYKTPQQAVCERCDGSGEEPGAPVSEDGTALCGDCNGTGLATPVTTEKLVTKFIRCGEYEFFSRGIHNIDEKDDEIAKTFYGGKAEPYGDGYLFHGGEVYVDIHDSRPITTEQAAVLRELGIV